MSAHADAHLRSPSPGAERVLSLARRRGRAGVHSSDFAVAGDTADGGKPLLRLAARIDELRNLGHRFETHRRHDMTVDYELVADADDEQLAEILEVDVADVVDEQPRLFDPPPAPPREAALFDWEDAA